MSAILEVKGLKTSYGRVNVLAGVDLSVAAGETYALERITKGQRVACWLNHAKTEL